MENNKMNSTMERIAQADNENFLAWIDSVKKYAGTETDFHDACDVYSFATAYDNHMTAKAAWQDYWDWVNAG
jgi:hypothetical protein